jgi:ABC-type Fe3+/spermidine/putrescine transport system ATPase subunit
MGVKLTLRGVSKSWSGFQLKDIDLEVGGGEYFVLLGPTGAGKTLLLEAIMGYHNLDNGKILLDEFDITETKPFERNIGYVPQTPSLSLEMTVRDNIEYGLKRRGFAERYSHAIDGVMKVMGLSEMEDRLALFLSGGERRKLALARVLILEPDALLLDEPLSSIDEKKKRDMEEDLKMIQRYLDLTVIHVTHDQFEAYNLADRLGVMDRGEIIQVGTPVDVYSRPINRVVASFIGYENIFDAKLVSRVSGYTLIDLGSCVLKAKQDLEGEDFLAFFQSHDIKLSKNYFKGLDDNTILGTVTEVLDRGILVTVTADIGVPIKATLLKSTYRDLPVKEGEKVYVNLRADDVKLIPQ